MPEEIPDDAIVQIEAHELDSIFHSMLMNAGEDIGPHVYKDAYQSGQEDMARQFHREVIETGDIVIE